MQACVLGLKTPNFCFYVAALASEIFQWWWCCASKCAWTKNSKFLLLCSCISMRDKSYSGSAAVQACVLGLKTPNFASLQSSCLCLLHNMKTTLVVLYKCARSVKFVGCSGCIGCISISLGGSTTVVRSSCCRFRFRAPPGGPAFRKIL